jgi:hypothetical protein
MAWETVSQTGICPWGDVESWTSGVDECPGGSRGRASTMSGISDMKEASVGGRVSSVWVPLDDMTHN